MEKKVIFFRRLFFTTLSLLLLFVALILLIPRETIIGLISEKPAPITQKADIYFVFSGGFRQNSIPGFSTEERIGFLKKLLAVHPNTPFVFLDYGRGKAIASKLLNRFGTLNLSSEEKFKYNPKISGTINNVKELVNFLKKHPEYKTIGIITSAYHEKRIKILLDYYLRKNNLNVKVYFFHDKHQEIFNCKFKRYISLVFHEFAGIVYFKILTIFKG